MAAGLVVLVVPGWAWLAWFSSPAEDLLATAGRAVGLSIALTATGALATFVIGWTVPGTVVVGVYAGLTLAAVVGQMRRRRTWQLDTTAVIGLLVFVVLIVWRFAQVRELALPAWVDSLHHVLVVRKILETGSLPHDLMPYMPVPFYYHFAFHLVSALFAFWSSLTPDRAVLGLGQVLNAAVALGVYRLGVATWQDRRKAGLAAVLVGFVSEMPAYYASWGRYTMLTGLVLLPLAMAAALEVRRDPTRRDRIAELAMLTAGVLLTHYFVGLLLAVFLGLVALEGISRQTRRGAVWAGPGTALLAGGAGGVALVSPWLWRVWVLAGPAFFGFRAVLPTDAATQASATASGEYVWSLLGPAHNYVLLLVAAGGLGLTLWRRESRLVGVWGAFVALGVLPWGLRFGPFRPDHFAIVLFLPACLAAGELLVSLLDQIRGTFARWPGALLWSAAVLALLAWGIRAMEAPVNPTTVLASEADRKALRWIDGHTPPSARFLINATVWQSGVYRGVDGGYWILPYTGRQTLVPPLMYTWGDKEYVRETNELAEEASRVQGCTDGFRSLVAKAKVQYIYATDGRGSLDVAQLRGCAGLRLVYEDGPVQIWEIGESGG